MEKSSVVCFDGDCNLCNGFVRFVIPRDPRRRFRFAPISSEIAARLLREAGAAEIARQAPGDPGTVVLIESGRCFVRSAAVLRIARGLRFPWSLAYGLVVVPRPLRDWAYDVVARNRFRWFGEPDRCLIPGPETADRFLV
jgi:predicted DCC family thiol-disulfide oxidoreductase YuxK